MGHVPLRSGTGFYASIFTSRNRQRISAATPHAGLWFGINLMSNCKLLSVRGDTHRGGNFTTLLQNCITLWGMMYPSLCNI